MKVETVWIKNYQVSVTARQFQVPVDEAPEYGGEDTGMMPTEQFLSSLASCFCISLAFVAKKDSIEVKDLKVEVIGEKDRKNSLFSKCIVEVYCSIEQDILVSLVNKAKRYCYVTNTIKGSCPIEYKLNWN